MKTIGDLLNQLLLWAPLCWQEDYDNSGLITGEKNTEITSVLVSLDATEEVVDEAIAKGCNTIVSHHPIVFRAMKQWSNTHYVTRVVKKAIKHDIALIAIHTNLDHIWGGVNTALAHRIGAEPVEVLKPISGSLSGLEVYVPSSHTEKVRKALGEAGAGELGEYSHCAFLSGGTGIFYPKESATPFVGAQETLHREPEDKIECICSKDKLSAVLVALRKAHPYEEIAYRTFAIDQTIPRLGSGVLAKLPDPTPVKDFLQNISEKLDLSVVKHTKLLKPTVQTIALCGGSGAFLIEDSIAKHADIYITSDIKYHEFFEADHQIVLADIGHFESEQHVIELISNFITAKKCNFAVHTISGSTNPVQYFVK